MTIMPAIPTAKTSSTYRTQTHRTDRILRDWIKAERLAFDRTYSLSLSDLSAMMPERCKEQLGDFKPTDPIFRKMSSGFNNVSDVWIELMRFIGVWDFSVEQAIMGTVSVFLDKENVRVKLFKAYDDANRANHIEIFCLNEPDYQGKIGYEGDRLVFPQSVFDAVLERRLNVYNLNCDYLSDVLFIPDLIISESNAEFAKAKAADPDDDEGEPGELEAEQNTEAKRDAHLEKLAEDAENAEAGSPYDDEIDAAYYEGGSKVG